MSADPEVVRREYATEARLEARSSIYERSAGPNPIEIVLELVAANAPCRVLEVGPGTGRLAARIVQALGCGVHAIDLSPRMVQLARARGVDAQQGDVQDLPFADAEFDVAIAASVLFHVPDLDRGLVELARVVRPGGQLIAVTNGADHLIELWALFGEAPDELTFNAENGAEMLRRHFDSVQAIEAKGTVTFPDRETVRRYVAATIRRSHLADRVPELDTPLIATRHQAVFTARRR